MTTTPRRLNAPAVWSQPRASLRTAQASHAWDVADLANDGASGHVGQRATILRNEGGVFHCFWHPATTARFLEVAVTVGPRGGWSIPDGVTVELEITDGTATVVASDVEIPTPYRGTTTLLPGIDGGRMAALRRVVGHLDRTALDAAGLDATVPWRLTFTIVCGATACVDAVECSEIARFALDTAESFGDDPATYQPRGVITEALSRTLATLEAGYDLSRRTYHALSIDEGSPDNTTSATWAAITGAQSESSGVPIAWKLHPRRLGLPPVPPGAPDQPSPAAGAAVRITPSARPPPPPLPGTSSAWADVLTGAAVLADSAADTITWEAQVSAGSLAFAAYWIVDDA